MEIFDADGNRWTVVAQTSHGWEVNRDGTVDRYSEDQDGNREEWTEELCDSALRGVFAPWLWEQIDPYIDPRNEPGENPEP